MERTQAGEQQNEDELMEEQVSDVGINRVRRAIVSFDLKSRRWMWRSMRRDDVYR
jgi:hypothetical protein